MEMESSRRPPFDRSREPGLKRPRLAEDAHSNPNIRQFPPPPQQQRAVSSGATGSMSSRLRSSDRDRDSDDSSVRGPPYQPQQQFQELVSQYRTALAELTFNSKPIITNLTIIAGENLHAAKAIAGTVCANILEVPSDQKLPSLYLLDSIVKNIGRDYIKYFATRLPEVFCKAYKQVDPSIHPGMRHLFGTWKGVFPAQPLQMIEKELGFSSAVNGSSASRSDSQSQRQPHSIHVNPKYLERQRLQQSSKPKGAPSEISGKVNNSAVDVERSDRSTFGAERSWGDPSVKMQMLRPQREALKDSGQEPQIDAGFGEYEYGAGVSRNLSPGTGRSTERITEPGYEKRWFDPSRGVEESLSSQRNGYDAKPGIPSRVTQLDSMHARSLRNVGGRTSADISTSWKNSEEEEYTWDNMNARVTDQGLVSSMRKDNWTPDDLEKSDFDSHLSKWESQSEPGPKNERETSIDSFSNEQKEQAPLGGLRPSQWQLEEPHATDSSNLLMPKLGIRQQMGPSRGGAFNMPTSTGAAVHPGKSASHQRLSSSVFSSRDPRQSFAEKQGFPEKDHQQASSLRRPDQKGTYFPRQMDVEPYNQNLPGLTPSLRQNPRLGKPQPQTLQKSSPLVPSSQPRKHVTFSQQSVDHPEPESSVQLRKSPQILGSPAAVDPLYDHLSPHLGESASKMNPSSVLAAVLKKENSSITGTLNESGSHGAALVLPKPAEQPPLPTVSPVSLSNLCGPRGASLPSGTSVDPLLTSFPQRKIERPPLPPSGSTAVPDSNVASSASNPFSSLLSSLVAKGLISASKSEPTSLASPILPNQPQNQTPASATTAEMVSSVSVAPSAAIMSTTMKHPLPKSSPSMPTSDNPPVSDSAPQTPKLEIENLIGFEFRPDVLRQMHATVISDLFDNLPYCCDLCGLRLKLKETLDRHLKWHDVKSSEPEELNKPSRRWFSNSVDALADKAEVPPGLDSVEPVQEPLELMQEDEKLVPADETQCVCLFCGQLFEDFFSLERNEWTFKDAVYLAIPSGSVERGSSSKTAPKGLIVHANCISDDSLRDLGLLNDVKVESAT